MKTNPTHMKTNPTHTGDIIGDGPKSVLYPTTLGTQLRETKLYYITKWGMKFSKRNGSQVGVTYPHYHLELDTVKPIPA